MRPIAKKTDWDTEDMPKEQGSFVLRRHFSAEEIENLKCGNVPQEMEDKWFWYMEGNTLYAHRSWSGNCIFTIRFDFDTDEHLVTVNQNREQCRLSMEEAEDQIRRLLDWWEKPEYDYYHEWLEETENIIQKSKESPVREREPRKGKTESGNNGADGLHILSGNKKNHRKKRIMILVIAGLLILGGFLMVGLWKKNKWENQELEKYSTVTAGDMRGSAHRIELSKDEDGKALLVFSDTEEHGQEPVVKAYLVDGRILEEIKEVFIDEGMYGWDGRKFSGIFIADGANTSYSFIFADDDVSFSSQIYPEKYRKKLDRLDAVIEKYRATGTVK